MSRRRRTRIHPFMTHARGRDSRASCHATNQRHLLRYFVRLFASIFVLSSDFCTGTYTVVSVDRSQVTAGTLLVHASTVQYDVAVPVDDTCQLYTTGLVVVR